MFQCDCCNYSTPNKRSFEKHLSTKKHEKNIEKQNKETKQAETYTDPITHTQTEKEPKKTPSMISEAHVKPCIQEEIMNKANQLKMQVEEIKRTSQDVNDIRDKIFNFSEFIVDIMNKSR
jgi:hypothetical protein